MHDSGALQIGEIELFWLKGGDFRLDGGTMFGPVPKALWQKKYPSDHSNTIPMCNDPLLIKTVETAILVDTGIGNKLDEKQKKIFSVSEGADLSPQVEALGIEAEDVSHVVLTHCDFDHAGGVEKRNKKGVNELTFPNAKYVIQAQEWEDIVSPHLRSKSTYLKENFIELKKSNRLMLVEGEIDISPGVVLRHTGGHTRGHQLVEISSEGQVAVHLGDLFPTHAHANPLWVMAYDNFPLEVIDRKIECFEHYRGKKCWYTFYHDPFVRACRLDEKYSVTEKWPGEFPVK